MSKIDKMYYAYMANDTFKVRQSGLHLAINGAFCGKQVMKIKLYMKHNGRIRKRHNCHYCIFGIKIVCIVTAKLFTQVCMKVWRLLTIPNW